MQIAKASHFITRLQMQALMTIILPDTMKLEQSIVKQLDHSELSRTTGACLGKCELKFIPTQVSISPWASAIATVVFSSSIFNRNCSNDISWETCMWACAKPALVLLMVQVLSGPPSAFPCG